MPERLSRYLDSPASTCEVLVAALGWGVLVWRTLAGEPVQPLPLALFALLAITLKREGLRVAQPVTHSLAGVAALAAVIALGPAGGAWVAALSGSLHLAARLPDGVARRGCARWRLALFAGGLNALVALAGAALYRAAGGAWAPKALAWSDLPPLALLSLAWFVGDHVGWSVRVALGSSLRDLGRFLHAIRPYSIVVELLPLPLAAVVAVAYTAQGILSYALLSLFLVAVSEALRLLVATLARARQRVADLTTLDAFSRALLATKLDVTELWRLLHQHTAALVDARDFWLGLTAVGTQRWEVALATSANSEPWEPAPELVAWIVKHRVPLLIRDGPREGLPYGTNPKEAGFRSALFVPLQASGALLGLLAIRSSVADAFRSDDLHTVATFANQAAMAIQNARSLAAEQRRARQVHTVGEVSRRVAAILGMQQLFAGVVNLIRDAFGYYHVQLFTVEPSESVPTFRASTSTLIQERGFPIAAGEGLVGWVAQTGQRAVVDDVTADSRYRLIQGLEGTCSEAVVPLRVGERLVGILDVESDRPSAFGEDDLFVLQALADQMAVAIDDNRLYRAEKARRQLADTLREIASALNSTLEPRAVLDLVLTQLQRVIRCDSAAILEWRDGDYCIVAGQGRYAAPDRCLTGDEDAGLRRLAQSPVPFVFGGEGGADGLPRSLAVPLLVKGRLIGALLLERQGPAAGYVDEEVQAASAFASQAATAIENARLYEGEQRRARELAAISEVGRRVASILDLGELFTQIVHLVRGQFGYYHVSIYTIEPETGALTFRASTSADNQTHGLILSMGKGIIGWVAQNGESLLANDVAREPRYLADETLPATASEMAVPLRVEGRTVGVLDIQADRQGAFGAEDLFIVQTLADQVSVAVENARLYEAQQEEAWVSTALLQVAETLANLIGIGEVLDAVIRLVPLLVGIDLCYVFLRDEDAGVCQAVRVHGLTGAEREAFLGRTLEELAPNLWQAVQESSAPVGLDAVAPALAGEVQGALGLAGGLALPLRAGGETIGAMVVGHVRAASAPNRNRRAILTGIANQAAMAIRNAHLYIAQRQEAWISTALLQVAELAGRTRDLDEILASLARLTPMLVGVDRCRVFLWDREQRHYRPGYGQGMRPEKGDALLSRAFQPGDFPLLDRVRETGEPLAVENVSASDLVPQAIAEPSGMVSVLALPLRSQSDVLGIMLVDYAERPHRFPAQRVALLSGIANEAAIAIENVQLYGESLQRERMAQELRVARQIQATFLPEDYPSLPGWSIAAVSQPAREVGGDFYDFIPLTARRLGLVIADVSDKGVPAALFMALSRTVMRAVAVEGHSPAATLKRANDLLLADSRSGMFVTLFYGVLDGTRGRLTFASAGHNPPYWYRSQDGELVRLASRGTALGVLEAPAFEESRIVLQPGDSLLLYTDGVCDSFDPEQHEFGEEGLRAAIRSAAALPPQELVQAINRAVQAFVRGAPQFDDYTLVALKRMGQ